MSREVRITIDDDEVFERMKRRKRELDLSWEEVLHRGLRRVDGSGPGEFRYGSPGGGAGPMAGQRVADAGPGAWGGDAEGDWGGYPGRAGGPPGPAGRSDPYEDRWDRFADSVEAQVQNKVYNALRTTFGAAGIDVPEPPGPGLDREMADLSNAEDAVLAFDFLDDDPAFQVPLRVNLETSLEGLAVEVVAVRQGKSVRDLNRFDPAARQTVTTKLAAGTPAVLRFDGGAEGYRVEPVLRWGRDETGRPTVTDVVVQAVRLDEGDAE